MGVPSHDPWKSDLSAIKEPVNRSLILAGFVSIIIALLLVIRALSISEYSPNLASTLVYYMGLIILLFSIVLILLGRRYSDESTIIKDPVRRKHKVERIIRQSLLLLIVGLALSVFSFIITDFMNVLDGTVDGNESTNVENRPPIAVIDTINTNENEPIRFNVLTNDEDTENGNNLTVKEFTTPPNNNFYIYPNGTGEYIPTRNFTGTETYNYIVSDSQGSMSTAKIILNVKRINHPPIVEDRNVTLYQNSSKDIRLRVNDEGDEDIPTIEFLDPLHGNLTILDPNNYTVRYTPDSNYNGTDQFKVRAYDGSLYSRDGIVRLSVKPTIMGIPHNLTLDYRNGNLTAAKNVTYIANFTDDDISIKSVDKGDFDSAVINKDNNTVVLWAESLSRNDSNTGTVYFDSESPMAPLNINEPKVDISVSTEGITKPLVEAPSTVLNTVSRIVNLTRTGFELGSDIYKGTTPCFRIVAITPTESRDGKYNIEMQNCSLHPESVKLSTTGLPDWIEANFIPQFLDIGQEERANSTLWLRVPENNTSGTNDNNLYQFNMIADVILLGNSITQSNASLSFIANRPPFANAGSSETVYEGTLIKLDGRKSYDLDSDSLSYLWEQLPGNLYVNLSNNAISDPTFISPKVSNDSKLSFRLTVFDERGAESNSVVNFVIRDLNHVPQVTNQIINTTEDLSASINLNANDSDPEDKLSYNLSSLPLHGKLSGITPNLVYTPDKNYNGKDSFKYRVNDGVKSSIEDGTVTIVVRSESDPPQANSDTITMDEDNTLYFNGSYLIANDIDIDEYNDDNTTKSDLVISSISSPSLKNSKVNFSPVNNTIRYTPPMNFNGTDTFAYTIKDSEGRYDTGLVTVKIMVVNDKPNASNDLVYATEEVPININVTSNDSDFDKDDLLMVINNTSPLHGRLILNSINNMITYIPNSDYSGTDHFNYTISDTSGATDTGNVHVFLSAINDAPITFNQTVFTSHPNRAINIVMTGNDRDNDSLKFSIVDKPQLGEIRTIIPYNRTSSVIIYVPYDGLVEGIDTFTFNVSDGNSFDTGNVRVIIKSPLSKISSFDNPYIALDPGHYISGAIASIQDNNSADPKWIVSGNWKLILNNDTTTGIFDEKYKNHTDAQFSVAMNNTTTGYNQLSTKMFEAVMNMVITNGSALHKHQMYNFTLTNISIPNNTTMIFNGTTTLTMSDGPVHDIPISLTIKEGNVISILIDPARIGNHFGDTPIYGTVVKAFIVKK